MESSRRIGDRIEVTVQEVEDFLDSPAGRRFRRLLAGAAIVGAPLLFRLPVLKRYPLLRALEVAGGAALLVKFAEALRDWEPTAGRRIVLDVPGRLRLDAGHREPGEARAGHEHDRCEARIGEIHHGLDLRISGRGGRERVRSRRSS